jgi:hypothetical protein
MIYTADWLPQIAQAAGVAHLKAGQQMIGGSRVLQHWNLPDEQNQAKKALKEGIVDVLTPSPHARRRHRPLHQAGSGEKSQPPRAGAGLLGTA